MLLNYRGATPVLGEGCFVAENAAVIGAVTLGEDCSVWFGAAVRGDIGPITVGERTNIQDNAVLHCSDGGELRIGSDVSIGHGAVVHGAVVEDGVLIGMGAVVLDGAVIGAGSIVGAGAVVTKGTAVPPNSLVLGVPGRAVRPVAPGTNLENARDYVSRKNDYLEV